MEQIDIYNRNLQAIAKIYPAMANFLASIHIDEQKFTLMKTVDGRSYTLKVYSKIHDKMFLLHSQYDPIVEAQRFIDTFEVNHSACYIFIGFGLGYHFKLLCEKLGKYNIIYVIEPNPAIFKLALKTNDFSKCFNELHLSFCFASNSSEVYTFLRNEVANIFSKSKVILVCHQASYRAFEDVYKQIIGAVNDFIKVGETTMRTNFLLPQRTFINLKNNLLDYALSLNLEDFRSVLKGRPVVVAAAGPSLYNYLEDLRKFQDRVIIIAVSTALKTLLKAGIKPHFVTLIDFHTISKRYFEDIPENINTILIVNPDSAWEAVRAFKGKKAFIDSDIADIMLKQLKLNLPKITIGSTVSHLAFNVACFFEANPIVLLGLDLSYIDYVTHTPYTNIYTQWYSEVGRFITYETKEMEFLYRYQKKLVEVEANDNSKVLTDELMFSYLKDFEGMSLGCNSEIINCSLRGAKIKNTKVMPFSDVCEKYLSCQSKEAITDFNSLFISKDLSHGDIIQRLNLAKKSLRENMERLSELGLIYEEAIDLLNKVKRLIKQGKDANATVIKILKLKEEIKKYEELYKLMIAFIAATEFTYRQKAEQLKVDGIKSADDQLKLAERDIGYLTELSECRRFIQKLLQEVIEDINNFLSGKESRFNIPRSKYGY